MPFLLTDVTRLRAGHLNLWVHTLFGLLLWEGEERHVTGAIYILFEALGVFVLLSWDVTAIVGIRFPGIRVFGRL